MDVFTDANYMCPEKTSAGAPQNPGAESTITKKRSKKKLLLLLGGLLGCRLLRGLLLSCHVGTSFYGK
jgi:hypothetical protein